MNPGPTPTNSSRVNSGTKWQKECERWTGLVLVFDELQPSLYRLNSIFIETFMSYHSTCGIREAFLRNVWTKAKGTKIINNIMSTFLFSKSKLLNE